MKRLLFFLLLFPSLSFAQTNLGSGIALPWPIASGGTGQITRQAAIDALTVALGATNGYVWTTNGTNGSWQAAAGGGLPAGGNNGNFLGQYPNGTAAWGNTLGTSLAANTTGDGLVLIDTTAATVNNQRFSPRLRLSGYGWKTTATAASEPYDWDIYNAPIQGTTTPNSALTFESHFNGFDAGGMELTSAGTIVSGESLTLNLDDGTGGNVSAYSIKGTNVLSYNTLGSTVTASSLTSLGSSVTSTNALAANTSGTGKLLTNSGAATSGNQRYSPRYEMDGKGWETTNSSSNLVQGWWELIPVQGATQPNALASLSMEVNSRAALQVLTIDTLSTLNLVNASGKLQINGVDWATSYGIASCAFFGKAGKSTATGTYNTGVGQLALAALSNGQYNTCVGEEAGNAITSGSGNTIVGEESFFTATGSNNTVVGESAIGSGSSASAAANNTAIGYSSMFRASTGHDNVALGYSSGYNTSGGGWTGSWDGFIGSNSGANDPVAGSNILSLGGNDAAGHGYTSIYFPCGVVQATGSVPPNAGLYGTGSHTGGTSDTAKGSSTISFYPGAPTIGANSGVGLLNFYSYAATGTRGNTAASASLAVTIDSISTIFAKHITSSNAIGSTANDGVGITSSSVAGSDVAGVVTMTSALNAGGGTCTVTFGTAYATAPIVMLCPASTGADINVASMWATSTTTTFVINFGSTSVATNFKVNYIVIGSTP